MPTALVRSEKWMDVPLRAGTSMPLGAVVAALVTVALGAGCASTTGPGQHVDLEFQPPIVAPAFDIGAGPVVLIDEAHRNMHTAEGSYKPFAELLRRDGYVVHPSEVPFTLEALARTDILVIANALGEDDAEMWTLPTPSAFSPDEITAVRNWVEDGGALLLIADHMPWPGAAAELAEAFGLLFINGDVGDFCVGCAGFRLTFKRADESLTDHPITNGRSPSERVEHVITDTGQAFRPSPGTRVEPLMVLGDEAVLFMSQDWGEELTDATPRLSAAGWYQGVVLRRGAGRVAAFGEAAMFSAQVGSDGKPMGMNDPEADQNYQFVLNVMHWLSGLLEAGPSENGSTASTAISAPTEARSEKSSR